MKLKIVITKKVVSNSVKLINKNLELQQENEKLKNMIDNKIDILSERMSKITDCDDAYLIICDIIEELKEVLGE